MHEPCLPGVDRPGGASEWAELVPAVPAEWFLRPESACGIHGVGHTRRVGVHVLRLCAALDVPDAARDLALAAARCHDLGRRHDGVEPEHGAGSVARVRELGLANGLVWAGDLSPAGLELVFFAIRQHSLDDETAHRAARRLAREPDGRGTADGKRHHVAGGPDQGAAALELLWILKDADALDRVRLSLRGDVDPRYFRHPCTAGFVDFAWELLSAI